MKKILLFGLIFTFFTQITFAQKANDTLTKKQYKWAIMAWGGPNYSYRYVTQKPLPTSYITSMYLGLTDELNAEEPYGSFEYGVNIIRKLNRRFSILFGFAYNQYDYRSKILDTVFYGEDNSFLLNSSYYYAENFYNIPLAAIYTLWNKNNFSFNIEAGMSLGSLTEKYFVQTVNGNIYSVKHRGVYGSTPLAENYFSVIPFIKLGVQYKLTDRINILLQPGISYDIRAISERATKKYIYSADLTTGLVFKFKTYTPKLVKHKMDTLTKSHKWAIEAWGGPNYSYRKINVDTFGLYSQQGLKITLPPYNTEQPYWGYEFGLNLVRKLNNHFSILFGFGFNLYVYRSGVLDTIFWDESYDQNAVSFASGTRWWSPPPYGFFSFYNVNSRYYYKEYYYNMPLGVRYKLWNSRHLSFNITGGVSFGFLSERYFIQTPNGYTFRVGETIAGTPAFQPNGGYPYHVPSMVPFLKLGIAYNFTNRFGILLQSGFAYDSQELSGFYSTKHIYSADLTIGINLKI